MPADDHGLLARLDALTDLAARRRGLALQPDGRLAPAELHAVAGACALRPATRPRGAAAGTSGLDAAELLRTIAEAVGLLRTRGLRLEVTALRPAWATLDPGLRAGLVFAAWCHRVDWRGVLGCEPGVARLAERRVWVLRLLFGLPPGVDVEVPALCATVADGLAVDPDRRLTRAVAAAFLDPLVALGVACLDPVPPAPPARLRLGPRASVVIAAALIAAGEEVPLSPGSAD